MPDKTIENKVSDYYTGKLRKFGATPQGVDWNSTQSQEVRFNQLMKVLPENREAAFSLMDYGCGYGAMYAFLKMIYPNMQFTGYDISREMIDTCRQLHGMQVTWIANEGELKPVDFVVASGIFNVKMEFTENEWLEYVLKTLRVINNLSQKGFSFNVLTSYSDKEYMKENLYYANPEFLFNYCKTEFSKYVALLHDYPLYEFSILVRK